MIAWYKLKTACSQDYFVTPLYYKDNKASTLTDFPFINPCDRLQDL